tara:strand:+ start:1127 stop:1609 length:483 start_codon:yes stop_codon:yes gene_type:complete
MTPYVHKCRNIKSKLPILAWLIMIFQGMNPFRKDSWSHMAISIDGKYFDVTGAGCKEHTEADFLKKYKLIESHQIKADLTMTQFYDFFDQFRGREYDKLQIIGLLLKGLNVISFNFIGSDFKKLICNELIIAYLAHFHKFEFKDSDNFDLISTWHKVKEY